MLKTSNNNFHFFSRSNCPNFDHISSLTLDSITVHFDPMFVLGLECSYTVVTCQGDACSIPEIIKTKTYMSPSPHTSNPQTATISLGNVGSFSISVKAGSVVDCLQFKMSDGSVHTFGNVHGGGEPVEFGCGGRIIGFHGGFGGHLHNLGVYTVNGNDGKNEKSVIYKNETVRAGPDLKTLTKELFLKYTSEEGLGANEAAARALTEAKRILLSKQ
jgi:hypothetical protein